MFGADKLTKGQQTARKILSAAARCIAQIGIEKTSITALAKEAGLKRSLIAYHFPKKAEIFYLVVKNVTHEASVFLDASLDHQSFKNSEDKLIKLLDLYMEFYIHNKDFFKCLLLLNYYSSLDEKYLEFNDQIALRVKKRIHELLEKIVDEQKLSKNSSVLEEATLRIYSLLLGSINLYYTIKHGKSEEEYRKKYADTYSKEIQAFLVELKNG